MHINPKLGMYKKQIFLVLLSLLLPICLVWIGQHLSIEIWFYQEIRDGNTFARNPQNWQRQLLALPEEDNWALLATLNPIKPYEALYPEYRKISEKHFSLTFVKGFDPPYLRYHSKIHSWSYW